MRAWSYIQDYMLEHIIDMWEFPYVLSRVYEDGKIMQEQNNNPDFEEKKGSSE
jgi:hypothetical protein